MYNSCFWLAARPDIEVGLGFATQQNVSQLEGGGEDGGSAIESDDAGLSVG